MEKYKGYKITKRIEKEWNETKGRGITHERYNAIDIKQTKIINISFIVGLVLLIVCFVLFSNSTLKSIEYWFIGPLTALTFGLGVLGIAIGLSVDAKEFESDNITKLKKRIDFENKRGNTKCYL